jgi:hypothetical protein
MTAVAQHSTGVSFVGHGVLHLELSPRSTDLHDRPTE